MSDYDVTLGARLHTDSVPTAAQAIQSSEVAKDFSLVATTISVITCDLSVHDSCIPQESSKCDGGCGLKALTSSPTENYSYYAQTAVRPQCMYPACSPSITTGSLSHKLNDYPKVNKVLNQSVARAYQCSTQKFFIERGVGVGLNILRYMYIHQ